MATTHRCGRRVWLLIVAVLMLLGGHPWAHDGAALAKGANEPGQVIAEPTEKGESLAGRTNGQVTSFLLASAATLSAGGEQPSPEANGGPDSISVSKAGTVEMHVAGLPLSTVLETLSVQSHRNIVVTPGVTGTVTAHLYNVTFEEALRAVLASNGAGYREGDGFIYVYTNAELAEISASETPPITRIFPLHFCSSRDALAVVTPMLSEVGSVVAAPASERGLDPDANDAGGDSMAQRDYLAVRDLPDVLERIHKTLGELDVPPTQVLVEATILAVTLEDNNALGVDFTLVGGVDLELLGAISNAVTNLNLGELPTDRLERFNSSVSSDVSRGVPNGGLTIGVIKDHVGVFIRALETITDTVVLANPKVLALNRQRAQVIVGRRDGYLTTTVTETQAIQNIEFLETGTQLIFRPFIGNNGFVRMELHPEDSVGTVVNGLPSEQTTEVTTNVIVRDGQTILIGGLFREVTTDTRSQLPIVGNAPIFGPLFRGRSDRTVRQEVIILLTVHVVSDQDAYARAGEEVRQDVERTRVGLRRNMMWHGRERLAQAYFRRSLKHLAQGDSDRALWNVRMALRNDPHFASAVDLKEEILTSRDWDDEGATARDFIHRLIMEAQDLQTSDFARPYPPFVGPPGTELGGSSVAPPRVGGEEGELDDAP